MKYELFILSLAVTVLFAAPAGAQNVIHGPGSVVTEGVDYAAIGGGLNNKVTDNNGTVSGGGFNQAGDNAGTTSDQPYAAVGGGYNNYASGSYATIGGGYNNDTSGFYATAGGGLYNNAAGLNATIGGGLYNDATGYAATIGGGYNNYASGSNATIPGGYENTASGAYSFAAGRCAKATYESSFVWNGGDTCVSASTNRQFTAKAPGGVRFFSNGAATTGVKLAAGSGSWSSLSDRTLKDNIATVDSEEVLTKLVAMPISTWNYTAQDQAIRHMGPMAQDFAAAFGMGEDERLISTVDAQGVALAAIQGLYKTVQRKDAQIARLEEQTVQLKEQTARLQAELRLQREQTVALQHSHTDLVSTVQAKLDHLEQLARVAPTYRQAMHSIAPAR